jgi:uncharacterized protein with von Willebrand factor type A (vWA) domain
MVQWLCGFVSYLRNVGYDITAGDILNVVQAYAGMTTIETICDFELLDPLMRVLFCKTQEQAKYIVDYRKQYMKDYQDIEDLNKKLDKLTKKRSETTTKHRAARQEIEEQYSKQSLENERKRQQEIDEAFQKYKSQTDAGAEHKSDEYANLSESTKAILDGKSSEHIKEAVKEISDKIEDALWNGDIDKMESLQSLLDRVVAVNQSAEGFQGIKDEINRKYDEAKKKMDKEQKDALKAMTKIEKEQAKQEEAIQKEMSKHSRAVFDVETAHRAVQSSGAGFTDPNGVFTKSMEKLTEDDRRKLEYFIRKNSVALYTRMQRNICNLTSTPVNIKQTIKKACKTAGVPMQVIRNKPKRNRTRLVLVLDISGSCSGASRVMISFMHILSKVFTQGVKCFVFVNSLYDVSDIFTLDDTEQVVTDIFAQIPTHGVYSDYNRPLQSLYTEHKDVLKKDTMLLFIGDARNNKNPTGEFYLQQCTRRCKRAYWLNTEAERLWDTHDSIAGIYQKYCPMYEVLTARDIITFISNLR